MKFSAWWLKRARIPKCLTDKQIKLVQDVAREAYNTGLREGKKIANNQQIPSA